VFLAEYKQGVICRAVAQYGILCNELIYYYYYIYNIYFIIINNIIYIIICRAVAQYSILCNRSTDNTLCKINLCMEYIEVSKVRL